MKKSNTFKYFIILTVIYTLAISFNRTTFVLYLRDLHSLSRYDANLVYSVFNFSVIIFEPLTTPIAELFSKRNSFLVGIFLKIITAILFIFADNFSGLISAEIVSGLSSAFITGSLTAWAVDKLKEEGHWKDGYNIFAQVYKYKTIALIFGGLSGAYLGEISLMIPWVANMFTFIVLMVVCFFIMDTRDYEKNIIINNPIKSIKKSSSNFKDIIFFGYKKSIQDKVLFLLISSSFISSMCLVSLQMFRLPMIKSEFAISQITLGYIWVSIEASKLTGSFFVTKYFSRFQSPLKGLIFLPVVSSLFLISAYYFKGSFLMIIGFILFEFLEPFYNCLKKDILNSRIANIGRVTVLSFENIMNKFGRILGLLIIGYLADLISEEFAWYLSSSVFCITFIFYYFAYKINNKNFETENPKVIN